MSIRRKTTIATIAYVVFGVLGATSLSGTLGAFFVLIWFAPVSFVMIYVSASPLAELDLTAQWVASLTALAVNTWIAHRVLRALFEIREHRRVHRTSGDAACN